MEVKIYSKTSCPYCVRAKAWFTKYNVTYNEILVVDTASKQAYLRDCPGKKTVPQILINGELIGGYDDLVAKEAYVKQLLGLL
jgi:glutaredoxin 3